MTKRLGVIIWGITSLVGCTTSVPQADIASDQQSVSQDPYIEYGIDEACANLGNTIDAFDYEAATPDELERVWAQSAYHRAFCAEPSLRKGTILYCRATLALEPLECRENSGPFIACLADASSSTPESECSSYWLADECTVAVDVSNHSVVAANKEGVPGGLYELCGGMGNAFGGALIQDAETKLDTLELHAPAEATACADGHRYSTECTLLTTCSYECRCSVDGELTKTFSKEWSYFEGIDDAAAYSEPCGWTL